VVRTLEEVPEGPRIGQETLQRLPQGHGIRCPSGRQVAADAAGKPRWQGRGPAGAGLSGLASDHHHGPRSHVKHIRTTGPRVARCPPAE